MLTIDPHRPILLRPTGRPTCHRPGDARLLRRGLLALTALLLACWSLPAAAQWSSVGVGISYRSFRVGGVNDVFVARLDRSNPRAIIDTAVAQGQLVSGRETVSSMAARLQGRVGYWGETWTKPYTVVAAINGDFFDLSTGVPPGGQIQSGAYIKRFYNFGGSSGFAWKLDRSAFIGHCVSHPNSDQVVQFGPAGAKQKINGVNRARGSDELILYTDRYAGTTQTSASGVEVRVTMDRPPMVLPPPAAASGTIQAVRNQKGSTALNPHQVVLSASGSTASGLLANAKVGGTVLISQSIRALNETCSKSIAQDWTKTYASVGGNWVFLKGGVVQDLSSKSGANVLNPRTAIALNATHLFFVVVDGRSSKSQGMNMQQLGVFCRDQLKAVDGINQDGGGSSALWVAGSIRNSPSDGAERPVANSIMMINVPADAPKADAAPPPGDAAPAADAAPPAGDGAARDSNTAPPGDGTIAGDQRLTAAEAGPANDPALAGACSCTLGQKAPAGDSPPWLLLLGLLLLPRRRRQRSR